MASKGFNTFLFHTPQFQDDLKSLSYDRSVGIFKSKPLTVPDSFDGREVWKKFLNPVRDQGSCGSCWAFATSFSLESRLAIATNGKYKPKLSPAKMVLCNLGDSEMTMAKAKFDKGEPFDYLTDADMQNKDLESQEISAENTIGCNGETIIGAWQFLSRFGVPEEDCMNYNSTANGQQDLSKYTQGAQMVGCSAVLGQFFDKCPTDGKPAVFHRSMGYYIVPGVASSSDTPVSRSSGRFGIDSSAPLSDAGIPSGSEINLRRDIYHWGPLSVGFTVYPDFMEFFKTNPKGVYKWNGQGQPEGGHAVVIVGWGVEEGTNTPYWIIRNSWGTSWGDGGYFKFLRGSNHCGIEENAVGGLPNLFGHRLYLEWPLLYNSDDLALRAAWQVWYSGVKVTTLESMITGKTPQHDDALVGQYTPDSWPDVEVFVAGDPSTYKYRLSNPGSVVGRPQLTHFAAAALGGAAVGILVYYIIKRETR